MIPMLSRLRQAVVAESVDAPVPRHAVFAWLGIRPAWAQHTQGECAALRKWASGKFRVLEIGVAEGVSARVLREAMSPSGILWLIDPFHLTRVPIINATKRVARRWVGQSRNGTVVWIEKFSLDAARGWREDLDFVFVDGDHTEQAVWLDWDNWHRFVIPGGIVAFHDAAVFPGGRPQADWGSVKVVDQLFRSGTVPGWKKVEQVDSLVIVQRL